MFSGGVFLELELAVTATLATTNDELVGRKSVATSATALGERSACVGRILAALGATFTTTVWMLMMTHCNTTGAWAATEPTSATGLTEDNV